MIPTKPTVNYIKREKERQKERKREKDKERESISIKALDESSNFTIGYNTIQKLALKTLVESSNFTIGYNTIQKLALKTLVELPDILNLFLPGTRDFINLCKVFNAILNEKMNYSPDHPPPVEMGSVDDGVVDDDDDDGVMTDIAPADGVHANGLEADIAQADGVHADGFVADDGVVDGVHDDGFKGVVIAPADGVVDDDGVEADIAQADGVHADGLEADIAQADGVQAYGVHDDGFEGVIAQADDDDDSLVHPGEVVIPHIIGEKRIADSDEEGEEGEEEEEEEEEEDEEDEETEEDHITREFFESINSKVISDKDNKKTVICSALILKLLKTLSIPYYIIQLYNIYKERYSHKFKSVFIKEFIKYIRQEPHTIDFTGINIEEINYVDFSESQYIEMFNSLKFINLDINFRSFIPFFDNDSENEENNKLILFIHNLHSKILVILGTSQEPQEFPDSHEQLFTVDDDDTDDINQTDDGALADDAVLTDDVAPATDYGHFEQYKVGEDIEEYIKKNIRKIPTEDNTSNIGIHVDGDKIHTSFDETTNIFPLNEHFQIPNEVIQQDEVRGADCVKDACIKPAINNMYQIIGRALQIADFNPPYKGILERYKLSVVTKNGFTRTIDKNIKTDGVRDAYNCLNMLIAFPESGDSPSQYCLKEDKNLLKLIVSVFSSLDPLSKTGNCAFNIGRITIFESFLKKLGFNTVQQISTQSIMSVNEHTKSSNVIVKFDGGEEIRSKVDIKISSKGKNDQGHFKKYCEGNSKKNKWINNNPDNINEISKYLYMKELGDVGQVFYYLIYIIYLLKFFLENSRITNIDINIIIIILKFISMVTVDSVVYTMCRMFGLPCVYTGGNKTIEYYSVGEMDYGNYLEEMCYAITQPIFQVNLKNIKLYDLILNNGGYVAYFSSFSERNEQPQVYRFSLRNLIDSERARHIIDNKKRLIEEINKKILFFKKKLRDTFNKINDVTFKELGLYDKNIVMNCFSACMRNFTNTMKQFELEYIVKTIGKEHQYSGIPFGLIQGTRYSMLLNTPGSILNSLIEHGCIRGARGKEIKILDTHHIINELNNVLQKILKSKSNKESKSNKSDNPSNKFPKINHGGTYIKKNNIQNNNKVYYGGTIPPTPPGNINENNFIECVFIYFIINYKEIMAWVQRRGIFTSEEYSYYLYYLFEYDLLYQLYYNIIVKMYYVDNTIYDKIYEIVINYLNMKYKKRIYLCNDKIITSALHYQHENFWFACTKKQQKKYDTKIYRLQIDYLKKNGFTRVLTKEDVWNFFWDHHAAQVDTPRELVFPATSGPFTGVGGPGFDGPGFDGFGGPGFDGPGFDGFGGPGFDGSVMAGVPSEFGRGGKSTKHRSTKHRSIKHKSIKHKSTKHRSIKHKSIKHKSIKHKSIKHKLIKHKSRKHKSIKHKSRKHKNIKNFSKKNISRKNRI
jgi:hypothetical protein